VVKLRSIPLTLIAALAAVLAVSAPRVAYAAPDTSGIRAFFNDDRSQFVDFWQNTNGQVTIKVSNGRPWRPTWVVLHANFLSGGQVIGRPRRIPAAAARNARSISATPGSRARRPSR
jgi:hypothetical protein